MRKQRPNLINILRFMELGSICEKNFAGVPVNWPSYELINTSRQ
jgi:hypothetical protein